MKLVNFFYVIISKKKRKMNNGAKEKLIRFDLSLFLLSLISILEGLHSV